MKNRAPIASRLLVVIVVVAIAVSRPTRAAGPTLETASIADINAAFAAGTLTSEQLVGAYLKRIDAYDKQGPAINAVLTPNPRALADARALDAERKAGNVRGPLHGIPIVLKDNYDTVDLPTTAGSQLLEGHQPRQDASIVKRLRDAGVVVVAKVNLSEFAGSGGSVSGATDPNLVKAGTVPNGFSSAGGQTRNPHDLTRGPSGSSGGTGAAIAAAFAQFGLGTDTGGSVRGPSSANGIVGLKPTWGLLSRTGIVPLALSFDTGGPMARNVYDVAVALGVMTGVDPADDVTRRSEGKFERDYVKYLKTGALKGARIGIARDFMGKDAGTDRAVEEAISTFRKLGAVVVDPIKYPDYLLQSKQGLYNLIVASEFKAQIADYLKSAEPAYPRTLADIVARANNPQTMYRSPEKAVALKYTASIALDLNDPVYLAAKNEMLAATRAAIAALFAKYQLDVIVYPTSPRPATPIKPDGTLPPADSPTSLANESGLPDLIVPAGMTPEGLPVTVSFFGPAFSEGKLLAYGYDFEQATHAIAVPKHTPTLPTDTLDGKNMAR